MLNTNLQSNDVISNISRIVHVVNNLHTRRFKTVRAYIAGVVH